MMNTELLHVLGVATIASSVAVLLVLALRNAMRNRFGAQAAYALWSVVPLAAAVALLPAPIANAPLPSVAATMTPGSVAVDRAGACRPCGTLTLTRGSPCCGCSVS